MQIKKIFKYSLLPMTALAPVSLAVSCFKITDPNHPIVDKETRKEMDKEGSKTVKRNYDIDFTQHGIAAFSGEVKVRTLLYPAQTRDNNLDKDGVFNIKLHLSPVKGATGEWVAFATEVKSSTDNSLVDPVVIKTATTIANPQDSYPLRWSFTGDQSLENGKAYTFVFYKKDGSEVIVFNRDHIKSNKDIFPAVLPQ
ncbi:hypothetical protein [Mycoplasma simbae]|uniref:hypothetical protein n=1 Tax=Mycoplasma simbae TaxID=36744 RepID=UPI000495DF5C|nr:hypothetical protein [Mycoplasma simbae]